MNSVLRLMNKAVECTFTNFKGFHNLFAPNITYLFSNDLPLVTSQTARSQTLSWFFRSSISPTLRLTTVVTCSTCAGKCHRGLPSSVLLVGVYIKEGKFYVYIPNITTDDCSHVQHVCWQVSQRAAFLFATGTCLYQRARVKYMFIFSI